MTLRLNGSNSGFTEVKAPATAGSNTLTLPTSNGSANQVLKNSGTAGALEFAAINRVKRVYATEINVNSGVTSVEITGIPANALSIKLIMREISLNGTNHLELLLGHAADGGTYFTSGYSSYGNLCGLSGISGSSATDGMRIRLNSASRDLCGMIELYPDLANAPSFFYSNHAFIDTNSNNTAHFGAARSPDVSAVTIDRLKLIPNGTNQFNQALGRISLITEVME
jgi:hypothetical protein|tara:strand:+ start:511 stop:1188 length:678 start_codon:yes stop_codon:yes gene_type:complete